MSKHKQAWLSEEEWQWIKGMRAAKVCASKHNYHKEADAWSAIFNHKNKPTLNVNNLRAYKCDCCPFWHITKSAVEL